MKSQLIFLTALPEMVRQAIIEGLSGRRQTPPTPYLTHSTPSPLGKPNKEAMKPKSSRHLSVDKPDSSSSDENNVERLVSKAIKSDAEVRQSPTCLVDVLKPLSVRIFALLLVDTHSKMSKEPYQQSSISSSN